MLSTVLTSPGRKETAPPQPSGNRAAVAAARTARTTRSVASAQPPWGVGGTCNREDGTPPQAACSLTAACSPSAATPRCLCGRRADRSGRRRRAWRLCRATPGCEPRRQAAAGGWRRRHYCEPAAAIGGRHVKPRGGDFRVALSKGSATMAFAFPIRGYFRQQCVFKSPVKSIS